MSVTNTISYVNIIINVPKYSMVGKTFAVAKTLCYDILWSVTSSSLDKFFGARMSNHIGLTTRNHQLKK
jgi:hypothetical protein